MPNLIYVTQDIVLDSSSPTGPYSPQPNIPVGYYGLTSSVSIWSQTGSFDANDYIEWRPFRQLDMDEIDDGTWPISRVYSTLGGASVRLTDALPADCQLTIRVTVPCISGEAWHLDLGTFINE